MIRLLICAGGTGGGVYPALAVHAALQAEAGDPVDTLWVGGAGGMEAELVGRAGIAFEAVPAAGMHGVGLRALPGNLLKMVQGFLAARGVLQRFQPDVLFFTGGYVAVPVGLAARSFSLGARRPGILLYVPDIEPGLALKTLARFADCIAITAEAGKRYFSRRNRLEVTGYPVRADLRQGAQATARQALGLMPELPTLLVFGGSKGARSLNQALLPILAELLPDMQVLHVSGELDWPQVEQARARLRAELAEDLFQRYHAYPYLHTEMAAAFQAADLVVARAGAATLGELPAAGLPAILVPYPHAWRYQQVNANYLVEHGAAVALDDTQLNLRLLSEVRRLMQSAETRRRMAARMRALDTPHSAAHLAGLLRELASVKRGAR